MKIVAIIMFILILLTLRVEIIKDELYIQFGLISLLKRHFKKDLKK